MYLVVISLAHSYRAIVQQSPYFICLLILHSFLQFEIKVSIRYIFPKIFELIESSSNIKVSLFFLFCEVLLQSLIKHGIFLYLDNKLDNFTLLCTFLILLCQGLSFDTINLGITLELHLNGHIVSNLDGFAQAMQFKGFII